MAADQLHRPDQADLHQVPGRQQVSCLHHHRDHHHHHHRRHQAIVHHHQPHQHDHQLRDPMHCKKGDSFITKPAAKNNTVEQPRMSVSDNEDDDGDDNHDDDGDSDDDYDDDGDDDHDEDGDNETNPNPPPQLVQTRGTIRKLPLSSTSPPSPSSTPTSPQPVKYQPVCK